MARDLFRDPVPRVPTVYTSELTLQPFSRAKSQAARTPTARNRTRARPSRPRSLSRSAGARRRSRLRDLRRAPRTRASRAPTRTMSTPYSGSLRCAQTTAVTVDEPRASSPARRVHGLYSTFFFTVYFSGFTRAFVGGGVIQAPPGGVGAGFGVIERAGSPRGRRLGRECIRSHPAGDPPERLRASNAARAPRTARSPSHVFFPNSGPRRAWCGGSVKRGNWRGGWAPRGARGGVRRETPRALDRAI